MIGRYEVLELGYREPRLLHLVRSALGLHPAFRMNTSSTAITAHMTFN
jgi:hypothetical protein